MQVDSYVHTVYCIFLPVEGTVGVVVVGDGVVRSVAGFEAFTTGNESGCGEQ